MLVRFQPPPTAPCLVARPARVPWVRTSPAVDSKEAGAGGAPGAGTQCCPWDDSDPQGCAPSPPPGVCCQGSGPSPHGTPGSATTTFLGALSLRAAPPGCWGEGARVSVANFIFACISRAW